MMLSFLIVIFSVSSCWSSAFSKLLVNSTWLTTSSDNCFSTYECPSNSFCYANIPYELFYRCMPREEEGQYCLSRLCKSGLSCAENKGKCSKQLFVGDLCGKDVKQKCSSQDSCQEDKDGVFRCSPKSQGSLGSPCSGSKICSSYLGFVCKNKVCVEKGDVGTKCKNDWECASNICTASNICAPLQKPGMACTEDSHCRFSGKMFQDGDYAYCNKRQIYSDNIEPPTLKDIGICVLDSKLIKTLGAKCSPKSDRCDHRRGLSCKWIRSERRFGCQQVMVGGYCTPNSKYSRCKPQDHQRECFLARDSGGYGDTGYRFYQCNPKKEKVPIGYPCNRGPVEPECPKGATCEYVPNVDEDGPSMYGPPFLKACVYLRGKGESCGSKFETKCKEGLTCADNICIKGRDPLGFNFTHSDFGKSCATLPCVTGAKCIEDHCQKPTKTVGLGEPCYESVMLKRKCKSPLLCLNDFNGEGLKLCRKPHGVGHLCGLNPFDPETGCQSGLKCTPNSWYRKRKCYDEKKLLKIGDKCNPNATGDEKQCFGPNGLACLPKGSDHVCQAVASLYEPCAPSKNVVCGDRRLKCDESLNICL